MMNKFLLSDPNLISRCLLEHMRISSLTFERISLKIDCRMQGAWNKLLRIIIYR